MGRSPLVEICAFRGEARVDADLRVVDERKMIDEGAMARTAVTFEGS